MAEISLSTCFMKTATFCLHQRQSSLQLVLSSLEEIGRARVDYNLSSDDIIVKITIKFYLLMLQIKPILFIGLIVCMSISVRQYLIIWLQLNIFDQLQIYNIYCWSLGEAMTTQSDFAELLQKSEELNLKFKTKIIELENELNHERSKARQYENKFKDAVLQSQFSQGQGLLEKLNIKQKQLFDCRKQVIELNRRLANTSNSPSQNDLMALAHENQELMANIQEIKAAAINAIMMKEDEIQQLNKNIAKYDQIDSQLKFQLDKYESLQREFQISMNEKADQIRELAEKLSRERQIFLNKLELIQKQSFQEENYKVKLQEKTQDLQGTIEKSQMLIADYQNKIYELQNQVSHQKMISQQEKARFQIEMEQLKEQIQNYERQERNLNKALEDSKNKQRNALQTISKLNEKNQQLHHKLSMKKKKQSKIIKDKITSSFAGVAKANPVYASFAFRAKDSIVEQQDNHKHLGDFPQILEVDNLIQNFNFDELGRAKAEEIPNDVPISHMMTKKKGISGVEIPKSQPTKAESQRNQAVQNTQKNVSNYQNAQIAKEIQSYKQILLRTETQKKQLQITLNEAYNQMQKLNQTINNMSEELQQQRKNIAELRQQMKKTKKQAQLLVEVQSLTLHVQKLQMDMVASKLKYAEEADFARDKQNRERVMWTQKLVKLTEQLAKQDLQIAPKPEQKKKKRGFFG